MCIIYNFYLLDIAVNEMNVLSIFVTVPFFSGTKRNRTVSTHSHLPLVGCRIVRMVKLGQYDAVHSSFNVYVEQCGQSNLSVLWLLLFNEYDLLRYHPSNW